jgi:hypothetical protein
MKCTIQADSSRMIHIPIFMKIGTGFHGILRFYLSNLKGCNVGITDGIIYKLTRWDGVSCHDIHTMLH